MQTLTQTPRRNRFKPQSTGKRVSLKPRDWAWLRALRDHGPLPAHYLHAFTEHTHPNAKASSLRLTDLVSEDNTPHGGPYLCRPHAQQAGVHAMNRPLVYDLTAAGWQALETGLADRIRPRGPFRHQLMVAAATASIELGCQKSRNLRFIHGQDILDRVDGSLAVELPNPKGRTTRNAYYPRLIPDQLFALEYRSGNRKHYLAFVIECDRGSEPITSSSLARKSYERNFNQYRQFVGGGLYRTAYGLKCNMLVLNVMNSPQRQAAYLRLIRRLAPEGNTFMAFQAIDSFGSVFAVPSILDQLVRQPWQRAGCGDFHLMHPD